ncbi:FAD-dependent oxidoreductase [Rhizobium sp. LjRoot254]|uniref:FAD-dependent oxidoreductase n=1 Tax=Rhizobium sp. LjRoot254 TaxID=3342297 RepID=UPI003ECF6665
MLTEKTDVLIVGAGPTGLALAIALKQAGVAHLLVEKLPSGQNTSRAAVIHAHTLEALEKLDVVGELTRRGMNLTKFALRDRDRTLLRLRFDQLPSRYAEILMLPQDETEAVLQERLLALGGSVHWNTAVSSVEKHGDGHVARLTTSEGERAVQARFVVGADGMHSIVRQSAGIGFEGETYAGSFVLADITMDWSIGNEEVSLFFSPSGMAVVAPLPHGRYRVVATMENAPEKPGIADIQSILAARGPSDGKTMVREVIWSSRFRLHHRVATAYRNGGMLLMGDAAHVHSPAGGQGMNTGLVDAMVLGEALTRVVRDGRPETELDRYEALRRPAAIEVLAMADRLTGLAMVQGGFRRAVRNVALGVLDKIGPLKRKLELGLSGLSRKAYSEL